MPLRPSSNISIDAVRFPYTYYTNQIVKKISQNWQWSSDFGRLTTIIYFKVSKTGNVGEVFVKQSSGDSLFDSQAVRAVKLADPFPPLPFGYEDNELGIYFEFSFKE